MEVSTKNVLALLLNLHQDVEEYAEATVKNIFEGRNYDSLTYPPNGGLTELEKKELSKLENNYTLKSALRKLLADNSAGVIFSLLNLLDGTTDPKLTPDDWVGVKLIDLEPNESDSKFEDMLHDSFYESYWKWAELRG